MYKNYNSVLHNLGVITLLFFIFIFCLEHNTKTIRGINLKLHWSIDLDEEK